MKLIFKVFLFAAIILLLYATTLTDPHTLVFWTAFIQSKAFFWSLMTFLAVGGILFILHFRNALAVKSKNRKADVLMSETQAKAAVQQEKLNDLKHQLEDSYRQKEAALEAEYDHLKEPYEKNLKELKEKNLALKEAVAKLMKALKDKQSNRP